jgi:alkanesulfonate monooxygenase SsuD/methylene tetrahydromethanopterin reductase-like flavin-dependent oxidoreductase (luciferase family)
MGHSRHEIWTLVRFRWSLFISGRRCRARNEAGFESLWTGEHVAVPAGYQSEYPYTESGRMASEAAVPIAEPMVWYGYIAARTSASVGRRSA